MRASCGKGHEQAHAAAPVHLPANPSALPARFLLIFSPGGMGRFFVDAAAGRVPIESASSDPVALAAAQTRPAGSWA